VPLLGVPGAATGAIAIGTAATSTSTIKIISTVTTISIVTSVGKAVRGSITRNTGATLPMGTGKRRISSAPMRASSLEVALERGRVAVAREHVPVAVEPEPDPVVAEPELVPVVAELEHDRAVAELEHDLVVAEPELVQVEAVPVPGHLHARLAVALRTKWVIVVHRPGLPLLAVEDLAAVVGTTREPAAAEAVVAWEVAVIVVAAAVTAVAVE
jgi:hypothetical protein